jgi:hypothetical protein
MARGSDIFALCLLTIVLAGGARADDLPIRKAGLWEMKMLKANSSIPEMTLQHCTDQTTDKEMNNLVSPTAKQICAKQDIQKTATGYVGDSVCSVAGASVTSHSEVSGDFNSAYSVTTSAHSDFGNKSAPQDTVTRIEAKWLGACKPDQKPGDIIMPGVGFKLNVRDAAKLQNLLSGGKQ